MSSEDTFDRIGAMFVPAVMAFRSAITDAAEELRAYVETHRKPTASPTDRMAAELGAFGADRIDAGRFADLHLKSDTLNAKAVRLLDRSLDALRNLSDSTVPAFTVEVAPGGDVAAQVGAALASVGRAFGAARVAGLVRTGRIESVADEDPASPLAFTRWTAAERRLAPPLIVRLAGADLDAGALAGYLDGTQKLVLLVDSPAPPASLARLITPGTFVMQTTDPDAFARLAGFDGPGIAAFVPEGCATFVHDPSAAEGERLTVHVRPDGRLRPLRRSSAFQQAESLALLDLLAAAPSNVAGASTEAAGTGHASDTADSATMSNAVPAAVAPAPVEPADTLAAWLLAQAGLGSTAGPAEH